ncbi:cytochrome P450 [Diaporthe helianthi]|uniref:Cytochrome P450 n=1 Tax=Diaporthe helianthi TaxID=158607 RepID=A0A2P5HUJ8_DIAHE|nr:cytochrome P450 [Diaporthe helianthi]
MPYMNTQMGLSAFVGVTLVIFTTLRFLIAGLTNPRRHIPGPRWARFTSVPMNYHRWRGDKFKWALPLHERYGPVVLVAPNEISVGSLEGLQTVHKMGTGFTKGAFHVNFRIGPEPSLFDMTDTRAHAERRRLFSRAFTAQSLRQNWQPEVRRLVDKAVGRIRADATAAAGTADVAKWWKFMASDVVSRISFGQAFNMLDGLDRADMRFWAALRTLGQTILLRQYVSVETIDMLARVLPIAWLKRVAAAKQAIYDQGSIAVENMRKQDSDKRNIFYKIVEEADHKEASGLTDDAIRSEAATFMIGGAETTSAALTYLTWAIVRRPELQKRIGDEVASLKPDFTDEDVEALPLLSAVVTEALRMYNPTPGANARVCPAGGATVEGVYIPGGSTVCTVAYAVHRIPEIFPNGNEFDETRFEDPSPEVKAGFSTFMVGSRSCIGKHLAMMELRLATALLFRECRGLRLAPSCTDESMEQLQWVFTGPRGGKCEMTL